MFVAEAGQSHFTRSVTHFEGYHEALNAGQTSQDLVLDRLGRPAGIRPYHWS